MTAFGSIVVNTLRGFLGGRRSWLLLALAMIPGVVQLIAGLVSGSAVGSQLYEEFSTQVLFTLLIPAVAITFGANAFGEEKRGKTMAFLTLRPISRWTIAAAKLVAAWLGASLVGGLGAVFAAFALGVGSGIWTELVAGVVGATLSALVYAALLLPLGLVMKRATLAGLVYLLLIEQFLARTVRQFSNLSPFRVGTSAYADLSQFARVIATLEETNGAVVAGAGGATLKALVIALIMWAITGFALRELDLV
ncbi:MAG: ABC transporter permease [Acidimicrobiia bacterium]|nr:ABC transporter permease [Acidimicrobiia bacterium]NNL28026.1 ABC transporter permease subunit [Acidimicrobiia bacterium]